MACRLCAAVVFAFPVWAQHDASKCQEKGFFGGWAADADCCKQPGQRRCEGNFVLKDVGTTNWCWLGSLTTYECHPPTCATFDCPEHYEADPSKVNSRELSVEGCCKSVPQCKNFPCGIGFTVQNHGSTLFNKGHCCKVSNSCADTNGDGHLGDAFSSCPKLSSLRMPSSNVACAQVPCEEAKCCVSCSDASETECAGCSGWAWSGVVCQISNTCSDSNGDGNDDDAFECPAYHALKGEAPRVPCVSAPCTQDECCERSNSCADTDGDGDAGDVFVCPEYFSLRNPVPNALCKAAPCSQSECCEQSNNCADSNGDGDAADAFVCPAYYSLKSPVPFAQCLSAPCEPSECCAQSNSCADMNGDGLSGDVYADCPEHWVAISPAPTGTCDAAPCSHQQCCIATCATWRCKAGFIPWGDRAGWTDLSDGNCCLDQRQSCTRLNASVRVDMPICREDGSEGSFDSKFCTGVAEVKLAPRIEECVTEACKQVHLVRSGAAALYTINLVDVVIELVAIPLAILAVFIGWPVGDRPRGDCILLVAFLVEMVLFIVDLGLQVAAIVFASQGGEEAVESMKSCVNLAGRDICIATGEAFKNIRVLGIFELVIGVFTTGIDGTQLRSLLSGEPLSRIQLVGGVLLTLFSMVLTIVDFFVFTVDLNSKQQKLFDALLSSQGAITWCAYDVSYYTTRCVVDVASMGGLAVPSLAAVLVVALSVTWHIPVGAHGS